MIKKKSLVLLKKLKKQGDSSIEETAQTQNCKNIRYVNSFYKNVSFEYNDCKFNVMKAQPQPGIEELPSTTTVIK